MGTNGEQRSRSVRFDDMARSVSVRVDRPEEAGVDRYVGLEHLDPDCLDISRWGSPADVEATKLLFEPGDVIYGRRRAYQRKLGVARFAGICSAHALVLRARSDVVLPQFLPFFMHTDQFHRRAIAVSVGSLSPTINWPTLAGQEFTIPTLDAQQRAVRVLEAVEDRRRGVERVLAETRLRKRAALSEMFASFDSSLELGDAAKWLSGGTPARGREEYWGGELPWLSPKDMRVDTVAETQEWVTQEGASAGSRIVDPDTVFIVVRGMILAHSFPVARAGIHMAFNQDLKGLVAHDGVLPAYLFYWLQHHVKRCLNLVTDSSHGTKRVPTEAIQALAIECPSEAEQRRVVEVAEAHDRLLHAADEGVNALRVLRHALLTELVPDAG
jgi:type I restriction enzyme S subunit